MKYKKKLCRYLLFESNEKKKGNLLRLEIL